MIVSTELRKGNIVCLVTDGHIRVPMWGLVLRVHEILTFECKCAFANTRPHEAKASEFSTFKYVDLFPIPLTPEILKKFGFTKQSDYWGIDNSDCFEISDFYENGTIRRSINGGEYHFGKEIKYVHELQNAYQVHTGKELKIKL